MLNSVSTNEGDDQDSQSSGSNGFGYRYDPFGKRVRAIYNTGPAVYYVFDGDRLIGEVSSTGAIAAYTWGPDGIVSARLIASSKSLYYHFGPQGEARQLTTTGGSVADSYLYTAYGVTVASSGMDYNPHRYGGKVGYYTEGVFGLMLATHRWYSPNLMRWMTRDPIEYRGGENMNGYVMGNPVRFLDQTGLDPDVNLFTPDDPISKNTSNIPDGGEDALTIAGHGNLEGIVGPMLDGQTRTQPPHWWAKTFLTDHREKLRKAKVIILYSCDTGKNGPDGTSVGQRAADVFGKPVIAPDSPMWSMTSGPPVIAPAVPGTDPMERDKSQFGHWRTFLPTQWKGSK